MGGLMKTPKPPGPSEEDKRLMAEQKEETARLKKENAQMEADDVSDAINARRGKVGRRSLVRRYYGIGGGS